MTSIRINPNKGYVGAELWVPKAHVNVEGVKRALTFVFAEKEKVTTLCLWKETEDHLLLPREFWADGQFDFEVVDIRPRKYVEVDLKSNIKLYDYQQDALDVLRKARGGILQLACGKGKTIVSLQLAAELRVPTLIVVDNTQLLSQWKETILGSPKKKPALGISPDDVGLIQGSKMDWKKPIVLTTYQTLALRADTLPDEIREWFGLVIWDEAHHIAAPTFSKGANLFYGYRLGLTATPTRTDGLHVIYDFHLGKVLYKDLKQDLRPKIFFKWTGLQLDTNDPEMMKLASDKNGELHNSKLASFFGQWPPRLQLILDEIAQARKEDRKVLVIANSIDELVNLYCLWSKYPKLYTDIPTPTPKELGLSGIPQELDNRTLGILNAQKKKLNYLLLERLIDPVKKQQLQERLSNVTKRLEGHETALKVAAELNKRQRQFLKEMLDKPSDAGLMIGAVKPEKRSEMLRTKNVVFAIAKYGREGLDEQALETVIICEPMSAKNGLQQTMGRVLRPLPGKKQPIVVIFEDDIGPMNYMCMKLRQHLREWPVDEGGPYDYVLVGHPSSKKAKAKAWMKYTSTV